MTSHIELLHSAARYTLTAVDIVTPDLLTRPTPCTQWNLRMLLSHTCESVAAFQECLDRRRVALFPGDHDKTAADPAESLRHRLTGLVNAWTAAGDERDIAVADHRIPLPTIAAIASLEIAVHGWDIVQASGQGSPIPADLAGELLRISPQLITDDNRHRLFAPPIHTSVPGPDAELIAFLGRRPEAGSTGAEGRDLTMNSIVATAEITIAAPPTAVWVALTDPAQIKQYMFGSTVETDWQPGSPITWSGEYDGQHYRDKGEIVAFDPPRLLEVTHFSPMSGKDDVPENYHLLRYTLTPTAEGTHLVLAQDNNADDDAAARARQNWQLMLTGLKRQVEGR